MWCGLSRIANHLKGRQREQMQKTKMTHEGQPCRKCGTKVVKFSHGGPTKPGQKYWFRWWLYCAGCKTNYMVEEAKVTVSGKEDR